EGVLVFDGGDNQNWTMSNIRYLDFDLSIGMFAGAGGTDAFNGTIIQNNYIRIPNDLNTTVAPADVNQNIGIHYAFGTNQLISGNTIETPGDGVSDSALGRFSSVVGMQSNTSGGSVYDGLQITNNIIRVLNAQSADPQNLLGIWENAHGHTSDITVSGNTFTNLGAGNNPATNLQRGFRVTSHSSATTTVTYENNTVTGANIGFQWISISPPGFAGNQPVIVKSNTITGNATGVLVQSQGLANLSFNRIVGNTVTGLNNVDGIVTAENNWWGCNAGPGNAGCDSVTGVADFDPWIVLGVSASPAFIPATGMSTITADMTKNSDLATPVGTLPDMPVAWSATNGTMSPPSGTITNGQASSTFTASSNTTGSACATVDNQLTCTTVGVGPTAADGIVSGRVLDLNGVPVAGVVINLSGTQNRKSITNANGNYYFDNVETTGFYTVTPARANYSFSPFNRSFSQLGNHTDAAFTASAISDAANPLDTPEFFVRQQYLDVLGREPDEGGFNYWSNEILRCGGDTACSNARRRDIAAAFFIEDEFQDSGSYIYDAYKGALGRRPLFSEYVVDRKKVVGGPNLDTQKAEFADSFVERAEFMTKYQAHTTAVTFIDALLATAGQSSGVDLSNQRDALIHKYQSGGTMNQSRSLVLQELADNATLKKAEYNAAFVLTEYFSYLQRDPEPEGYDFWLNVINNGDVGNYRGMVCSFITSTEYQKRFSSVVTHSNAECGR
ncbi:MAG: DUF4214 domain-containing protein, partial [Pyrinomonadaceae bacterium]